MSGNPSLLVGVAIVVLSFAYVYLYDLIGTLAVLGALYFIGKWTIEYVRDGKKPFDPPD